MSLDREDRTLGIWSAGQLADEDVHLELAPFDPATVAAHQQDMLRQLSGEAPEDEAPEDDLPGWRDI